MKKIIGERLISVVWFCEFEDHGDGTATVLAYYPMRSDITWIDEHNNASILNKGRILIEDENRHPTHVNPGQGPFLVVRNPRHIFSYGKPKNGEAV